MKCFKCEKILPHKEDESGRTLPDDNANCTVWRTEGDYCSAAFDLDPDGGYAELYICDDCLRASDDAMFVVVKTMKIVTEKVAGTLRDRISGKLCDAIKLIYPD